jgi:hypothetical protein
MEKTRRDRQLATEEEGLGPFHVCFYERRLRVPECFIAARGTQAGLHVANPDEVSRCDGLTVEIPSGLQLRGTPLSNKAAVSASVLESDEAGTIRTYLRWSDAFWAENPGFLVPVRTPRQGRG